MIAFLSGVCISLFSDKIRLDARYGGERGRCRGSLDAPGLRLSGGTPGAYLTVYFGMLNPPKIPVLSTGDYSYGLYLFA